MTATISGLSTIRSFKSNDKVIDEFNALQNNNITPEFLFTAAGYAMGLWLEIVCVVYMLCVLAIFLICDKGKIEMDCIQCFFVLMMSLKWLCLMFDVLCFSDYWRKCWIGNNTNI